MGGGQVLATQMNELQTKSLSFPRISRIDRFKISTGLELTQSVINFPIFSLHSGNFDSNFFCKKNGMLIVRARNLKLVGVGASSMRCQLKRLQSPPPLFNRVNAELGI